ncbi:rhamnulokinase [Planctomycetaceae bacterium]|jgi:rhamnulokinase|nr:rhamnulokinase [Planctomycetaceae bacterium]MDC0273503.1 rhamnulokinase [Planctomycetaceae bacterium]
MTARCYLGVDLGASSGRVVAGLFDGRKIELKELHRFSNGPVNVGGSLRWDVLQLWSGIQDGLTKAKQEFGSDIASVGVDTWGVDYVLLSKTGEILGQPYNYRDSRTDGMMEKAFQRVPREEIFSSTGLQFIQINTLYQLIAMQQANPELMELADQFLMMPDFFNWCLSGSKVVEFTNATTSQCYDPNTRDWSYDLLGKFDIPTEMFGEVVAPGTKLGQLRQDVAERTGLPRLDVIAPATHDTGSAVVAVPTELTGSSNWAYLSSGTYSLLGVEVQEAILSPRALELNVTNEGGVDGTYRLLKNIMGLWLITQIRESIQRAGRTIDYGQLVQRASVAEPFRSLINPDDPKFLNPSDMPTAIREWCREHGQPEPETEGQLARCAFESLALKYRVVLNQLEELTGTAIEVIHIVGGGSQNELLNQFAANACGRPVIAGPVEGTVMGNVLVQARSFGEIGSLSEIREVVHDSAAIKQYEPTDLSRWDEASERFAEYT